MVLRLENGIDRIIINRFTIWNLIPRYVARPIASIMPESYHTESKNEPPPSMEIKYLKGIPIIMW